MHTMVMKNIGVFCCFASALTIQESHSFLLVGTRPTKKKRCSSFLVTPSPSTRNHLFQSNHHPHHRSRLSMSDSKETTSKNGLDEEEEILGPLAASVKSSVEEEEKAVKGTVNQRLLAELEEAVEKEKYGARSTVGKKLGLDALRSPKTDEERKAAIEEARNLNGVNPLVCLAGGVFAMAAAGGLWALTSYLATFFALHPVESDMYFVQRSAAVFRNVVMGLSSLASGFFGVTGLGIFLLGCRVGYGVMTGELDPTPIRKSSQPEVELPNVWELMTNTKRGRRGKRKKNDDKNNPFGI